MSVQTGEAHGAYDRVGEAEVSPSGRQEARALAVLLGQAEVDEVEALGVGRARATHQQVVGADVAVSEAALMHELNDVDQLVEQLQHRLERQAAAAAHQQVVEGRAEQVDDQNLNSTYKTISGNRLNMDTTYRQVDGQNLNTASYLS